MNSALRSQNDLHFTLDIQAVPPPAAHPWYYIIAPEQTKTKCTGKYSCKVHLALFIIGVANYVDNSSVSRKN